MKKVLLACILSLGTVAVLQAQDSTATQTPAQSDRYATDQQQPAQKEGMEVAAADLPAPIQDKLKGSDYSGWTVDKAKTKMKDGKTCYAVELKNGSEKKKIVFDESGNVIKEKD